MIKSTFHRYKDLVIFSCSGKIVIDEIKETLAEFYRGKPTKAMIWDFSKADSSLISSGQVKILAESVKAMAHSREGGKTAIVAEDDVAFGLSRMYQIFAEVVDLGVNVDIFRNLSDAKNWISE